MHDSNFREFFDAQCKGQKTCNISQVDKFLESGVESNRVEICQSSQSRFYLTYQCTETKQALASKQKDAFVVVIIQIASIVLVLLALLFNAIKTLKMGKQYDELNLSASDYTLHIDVTARHRHEFMQKYQKKLEETQLSRGFYFKKFISDKLRYQDVRIARIDLVFDNKKMIGLL